MTEKQLAAAFLRLYTSMPSTPERPRAQDRSLARSLAEQGLDYSLVKAALLLGCARRASREPEQPPLPRVRSLAYFLPVIDELSRKPPLDSEYLHFLEQRLAAFRNGCLTFSDFLTSNRSENP